MGNLSDATLRFTVFAGVFVVMALLELALPKRPLTLPKSRRWTTNLAIIGLDSLLVRAMDLLPRLAGGVILPLAAVAVAIWAEANGVGLLNWLGLPAWFEIVIALVVLDFAIWLQHLAAHKIGPLWAFHQVHHADRDIDVTTAIRFHPIEIGLSMLYKMAWVAILGPAPVAVVMFEVILNACAMFNHANVALPARLDRILRLVMVTPDMHRVHHSVIRREHDSNYGFNLSIWDRLFGTYVAEPQAGHDGMTIGLSAYQSDAPATIRWSLTAPFAKRE